MKKTAYIFSKLFFYGFSLITVFVTTFSILSFVNEKLGWNIPFIELVEQNEKYYTFIKIPFLDLGFGFPKDAFLPLIVMLLTMLFYAIYFYSLKEFFKIFTREKIFSLISLKKLKLFYKINFIPIIVAFFITIVLIIKERYISFDEQHFILIVHSFIAFLIYLYLDLMKKGTMVQEENDLTI